MTSARATTNIPEWTLGWRLQRSLAFADMSVEDMGRELGVTRSTISRWMNDRGGPPRRIYVEKWAELTGVPIAWILDDDSSPPDPGETYCGNDDDNSERPQLRLVAHVQTSPSHAATPMDLPAAA